MTRKTAAAALAAAMTGLAALSACSDGEPEQEPEITLELLTWHGPDSTTNYHAGYQQIIDDYTAEHPEIAIEIRHEEDASYGNILETGFAGDTAPDLIQMKSAQRSTFAANLLDLRDYLAEPSPYAEGGPWIDTFTGGEAAFPVEDNGTSPNALLFVPNDGNPEVSAGKMYIYNKALIEEAGLDPDAPPEDWKDLFEWLEALSGNDDVAPIAGSNDVGGKVSQVGYGFGAGYADQFFAPEFNDPAFSDELYNDKLYILTCYAGGSQLPLTSAPYYPAMFKLMAQHVGYFQESWTENTPETEVLTFASGRAAMMNTTFWDYGTLVSSLGEETFPDGFGLFPVPYFGTETLDYAVDQDWITQEDADAAEPYVVDRPANVGGAGIHEYGFSVNAALADDPERLDVAIDFLRFLSSQEEQAKYVETAGSISPVEGVDLIDSMSSFVLEEPEGGFARQILGYSVVEWGKAGWDVDVTRFLNGEIDWDEMVTSVAAPEWVADIPTLETLQGAVATAEQELAAATPEDTEAKEHALGLAQLRLQIYQRYYYEASGDLVTAAS
ncbi:ABC-type glycerol-3-phosphate transport system substrate-binding protein [Jiangella mangrovi]|uniref:ABC-type glycerol-3-phosphate transport system substrate-binding protein n=2 Tax=Jiangella mangrovi TaxID=1524084 RepID=A0A7W9GXB1_9ACTN|nr:ABC-type glycerol-3-phosphate transport system substrate-binding protein [Jiangella mangrovi]